MSNRTVIAEQKWLEGDKIMGEANNNKNNDTSVDVGRSTWNNYGEKKPI